jgi:ribosomal-protein-alanine N-acetyltransferase
MGAVFETERLILREWTTDDAEAAFAIFGDPEVTRYLGSTGEPDPSLEHRRERMPAMIARYADHPGYGIWAMELKENGDVIGGAGLVTLEDGPEVEIAYTLRRDAWGKGYATEVAIGTIEYGFNVLSLDKLVGVAYPANVASHKVLLKAGMRHLGQRPVYGHELEWFEVERSEWKP